MTNTTFVELGLSDGLLKAIKDKGYIEPSKIQSRVIPIALNTNLDIVGLSRTGSGKTARFGLPILENLDLKSKDLEAIILAPTRELAIQVKEEISSFAKNVNIALLYGGTNVGDDIRTLNSNPKIIVGTPGRVQDHLRKKRLILDNIKYFVLDEADEMLNIGFREEIEDILEYAPEDKKMFLFSATMPEGIKHIIKNYMRQYEIVEIENKTLTNENIEEKYYMSPRFGKMDILYRILDVNPDFYGIVFCQTKIKTDEVAASLSQKGYKAEAIHGDIEQKMREKILNRFKDGKTKILVATDVAARGIDVEDLSHVINFDLPENPEIYTHRIGRTGRAGKSGIAITIVEPRDKSRLYFIEKYTKSEIKNSKLPTPREVIEGKKTMLFNDIKEIISSVDSKYLDISRDLLEISTPENIIDALLQMSFKDEFLENNYKNIEEVVSRERGKERRKDRDDGMVRLFVARGKKDSINNPGALLSFIGGKTGLNSMNAGKIDILTNFSYIDLPQDMAKIVLKVFKDDNPNQPLIVKAKPKSDDGFRSESRGRNSFRSRSRSENNFKNRGDRNRRHK